MQDKKEKGKLIQSWQILHLLR